MHRALPALVLALSLAACSSDPAPPGDAGGEDTASPVDLGPSDTGAVDTGQVSGDSGRFDAGVDALVVDGGVDVSLLERADTSPGPGDDGPELDTGVDAGQPDTGVDVPTVGLDIGPRDSGPVDAQGVQTFPLDPPPGGMEVRVLYQATCPNRDGGPCISPPVDTAMMGSCSRVGNRLTFSLRACTPNGSCSSVTGAFSDYRTGTGGTVSIFGGVANQGRNLSLRSGAETRVGSTLRQSFHVQFDAPALAGAGGATGVPERTVDPTRGDLWLLGCPVQ
jgi:hypothetical protein